MLLGINCHNESPRLRLVLQFKWILITNVYSKVVEWMELLQRGRNIVCSCIMGTAALEHLVCCPLQVNNNNIDN